MPHVRPSVPPARARRLVAVGAVPLLLSGLAVGALAPSAQASTTTAAGRTGSTPSADSPKLADQRQRRALAVAQATGSKATGSKATPRSVFEADARDAGDAPDQPGVLAGAPERLAFGTAARQAARKDKANRAEAPAAQAEDCPIGFDVNQLLDRTVLQWDEAPGATGYAITRQRDLGAWQTIATLPATARQFADTKISPEWFAGYRIVASTSTGPITCTLPDLTMSTADGRAYPDFVVATDRGLLQQNDVSRGTTLGADETVWSPAFSPNGRWVAYSALSTATDEWEVKVRRADGKPSASDLTLRVAGHDLVEPAFSPNGRYLAWAEYDATTASGPAPVGLAYADLFGTRSRVLMPGSAGAQSPAWLLDNRTVVAGDATTDEAPLVKQDVFTGVRGVVPGSGGSYSPDVAADGSMVFAALDDAGAASLKILAPGASTATTLTNGGVGQEFHDPHFSADRSQVYAVRYTDDDLADPGNPWLVGVVAIQRSSGLIERTNLGAGFETPGSYPTGFDVRALRSTGTSDFTNDGRNDLLVRDTAGALWAYPQAPADGTADFSARRSLGKGWNTYNLIVAAGDLNSDDLADVVARDAAGALWFYAGTPSSSLAARRQIGAGWKSMTAILATGDWDGDSKADLVSRDAKGGLGLWPGTGTASTAAAVGKARQIGSGWQGFNALVAVGDANYDNTPDLLARTTTGTLVLYPGNGTGGFGTKATVGSGFSSFTITGIEKFMNANTLVTRSSAGALVAFPFVGDGKLSSAYAWQIGTGWGALWFGA